MRPLTAVVLAVVSALAVTGCSAGKDAVANGTEFVFVSPGGKVDISYDGADRREAPELAGDSLLEPGTRLSTRDFAGRVIVVNLWGSWCPPCRTEAPELQKVQDQAGEQVKVIGIDLRDEDRSAPQDFLRDRGLDYPSIYDPPGRTLLALKGYPRATVPSTIVLDRQHRVAAVFLRELLATDLLPVVQRLASES